VQTSFVHQFKTVDRKTDCNASLSKRISEAKVIAFTGSRGGDETQEAAVEADDGQDDSNTGRNSTTRRRRWPAFFHDDDVDD